MLESWKSIIILLGFCLLLLEELHDGYFIRIGLSSCIFSRYLDLCEVSQTRIFPLACMYIIVLGFLLFLEVTVV